MEVLAASRSNRPQIVLIARMHRVLREPLLSQIPAMNPIGCQTFNRLNEFAALFNLLRCHQLLVYALNNIHAMSGR